MYLQLVLIVPIGFSGLGHRVGPSTIDRHSHAMGGPDIAASRAATRVVCGTKLPSMAHRSILVHLV